ncbi:hypothetical protein FQZ97_938700 [compost metagenome]
MQRLQRVPHRSSGIQTGHAGNEPCPAAGQRTRRALQAQVKLTANLKPVEIEVTERDNRPALLDLGKLAEQLVEVPPEESRRALSRPEPTPARLRQPDPQQQHRLSRVDRRPAGAQLHIDGVQALRQSHQQGRPRHRGHAEPRAGAFLIGAGIQPSGTKKPS